MALDTSETDEVLERGLAGGTPAAAAPDAVWSRAQTARSDELNGLHAALLVRREAVAAARTALEGERAGLERAADEAPASPHTRPADRSGRAGAPFWALVDFAEDVSDSDAAGIEAALEGAGLLDAWVLPDGSALGGDELDVVLRPGAAVASESLHRCLSPEPEMPVAADVTGALLGSIALGDGRAEAAVDVDGSFRLGPAHGRFAKPAAEWIGATARERRRAARIAAIDAQLVALAQEEVALDDEWRSLAARRERLAAEVAAFPTPAGSGALAASSRWRPHTQDASLMRR